MNSDGLIGFVYSHDGYWSEGYKQHEEAKTTIECAETCLEDCVAFNGNDNGVCFHYSERSNLVDSNKKEQYGNKAYVKCQGINQWPMSQNLIIVYLFILNNGIQMIKSMARLFFSGWTISKKTRQTAKVLIMSNDFW